MKKELVRCWKTGGDKNLFITYPEGDNGHRLICCKNCGGIHAVNVAKQLYIEPDLETYLKRVECSYCGKILAGKWIYYPEYYIDNRGQIQFFERSQEIPSKADSLVIEFPEVFS